MKQPCAFEQGIIHTGMSKVAIQPEYCLTLKQHSLSSHTKTPPSVQNFERNFEMKM